MDCFNLMESSLVTFTSEKLKSPETIWAKRRTYSENSIAFTDQSILDRFSYVNPKSRCFIDISFNKHKTSDLQAEIYGGLGTGENGGGVRCGNIGDYQLKGIGINPLLGDHDNYNHYTGNYSLNEAACEVIKTQIFGHILPVGVVNAYGLIYTGISRYSGDSYGYRLPLALMVREKCLRPGHLLPQPFFKPLKRYRHLIRSDLARVRSVNREFFGRFKDNNELILFFGKFLAASANQLAFGKLFRIAHGAYSPSNVCMDGRWLDLTNMTMVPAGLNYAANYDTVEFMSEPHAPIETVQQVLYNLGKFNNTDFNIQPLVNYYYEQFDAYVGYYAPSVLGIPVDSLPQDRHLDAKRKLAQFLTNYINGDRQKEVGVPLNYRKHKEYVLAIERLFLSLLGKPKDSDSRLLPDSIIASCQSLFDAAYQATPESGKSLKAFIKSSLVRSLRKVYATPIFNASRIEGHINDMVDNREFERIGQCIDEFEQAAMWVFDKGDSNSQVVLFDSPQISLFYCCHEDVIKVDSKSNGKLECLTEETALSHIDQIRDSFFRTCGYSCKDRVIQLIRMLRNLELQASC